MAFLVKYRIEFDTIKGRSIKIDIEKDNYAGSIINLIAASQSPLEINYPNAEFEKMTGIRESRVRFKVLSDGISASDLVAEFDTEYKVKIYIDNVIEWVGWLDNDYINEQYLDTLVEIELSANDGLSLIKSQELVDLNGNQFWGIERVKTYIAWALNQTKLELNFWSYINMYPASVPQRTSDPDLDAFYYAHITSFTFLESPRNYNDCYTVLSKIMQAFGCTLYQSRGEWYIIQTFDRNRSSGNITGTQRDYQGTALQYLLNQNFDVTIGLKEDIKLVNADAVLSYEKKFKESIIKYSYKMPPVFFRNWDLLDGTFNAPLSSSTRQVYTLNNWESPFITLGSDTYVGVEIDATTQSELRRYILFYEDTDPNNDNGKKTTNYYVNANDKLTFSYSTREKNAGFATSRQFIYIRIFASNGDYYTLNTSGKWILNTLANVGYAWANLEDRRFWKDYKIESEPFPVNGALSILITSIGHSRTTNNEVHFKDLTFSIQNYFNDMLTVDGYEYKNYQNTDIKNTYDNEIFISRSDNISTQGAILTSTYGQVAQWKYASASNANAIDFAKYIARTYWRTMYRNFIRLEGRLYNIYATGRLLTPLNTIVFDTIEDATFMLTTLNIDVRNEQAEFTSIELKSTETDETSINSQIEQEQFRYLNVTAESDDKPLKEPKTPIDYRFGQISILVSLIKRNQRRRFNSYS